MASPYATAAAGAIAAIRNQRKPAPAAKPLLKPETIRGAMDRRPRLNANTRRAAPAAAAPGAAPPAAPAEPAWMAMRRAGIAGTGSAAGNRSAAAGLPAGPPAGAPPVLTAPPPPEMRAKPMPMDDGMLASEPPVQGVDGGPLMGGGMSELPIADPGGAPAYGAAGQGGGGWAGIAGGVAPPPSSQNPNPTAFNLPPEIMQRLQALQAGRGGVGGQGAPGGRAPGAPAARPALPDFYGYENPALGGVQPPMQGPGMQATGRPTGFDRLMAY